MLKMNTSLAPLRVGATAVFPYSEGWESAFSFISRFGDPVRLSRKEGNTLHVARGLVDVSKALEDTRSDGFPIPITQPALKARNEDQAQVVEKSLQYLKAGVDHIVEAPTGFGKTFVGVSLALQMGKTTLIVVTKNDLVQAWRAMLLNPPDHPVKPGMGIHPSKVGHLQADVTDYKDKWFVIGMIHSLVIPGKYPADVWSHFGLAIFDEVHRLGAETFQEVCMLVAAKHRLGLSATPKRSDGKDRVFHAHIGPVLVKGTAVPMKPKILVRNTSWRIPEKMPYAPGRMGAVFGVMARNSLRNALCVEFTVAALKAGRVVVIMADTLEALRLQFHALCQAGVSGADIGYYVGQNTNDKLKAQLALEEAAHKRVILATFGMTKEGTDYPHWDTLVLLTPKSEVKQAIGRVMRSKEGKKQPVVLDLLDSNKIFQTFFLSRLKQYYSVGAEVVRME